MHKLVSNQPWAKSKWVIDQSECAIFFVMLSLFHFTLRVGEGGGGGRGNPRKIWVGNVGHVFQNRTLIFLDLEMWFTLPFLRPDLKQVMGSEYQYACTQPYHSSSGSQYGQLFHPRLGSSALHSH